MNPIKTYSISTDISSGKAHLLKLKDEIIASGSVTAFGSVSSAGDEITIIGGSVNDLTVLDAVFQNHSGEDLDRTKKDAKYEVDRAAGRARARYTTEVEGQQATYLMKEQDCRDYKAAGYPPDLSPYFFVQAELNAVREVDPSATAQIVADIIIATSEAWRPLAAAIEEIRRGQKEQIDIASSEATIENLKDAAVLALDAI